MSHFNDIAMDISNNAEVILYFATAIYFLMKKALFHKAIVSKISPDDTSETFAESHILIS